MPFNIDEFISTTARNGGFLKKNRFVVRFNPPTALMGRSIGGAGVHDINRTLEFYADSASIPGISLQTSEMRRQGIGNLEKTVYGAAFTDCDVRFLIDQKTKNWNFFRSWMETIYKFDMSKGTEFELEYKDAFCTTLTIFVYSEINPNSPSITIELIDAFPVSISDIGLDWGSSDLMKLNVRFNFHSWNERGTPLGGSGPVISSSLRPASTTPAPTPTSAAQMTAEELASIANNPRGVYY